MAKEFKIGGKVKLKPNGKSEFVIEDVLTGISANRGKEITLVMICYENKERWLCGFNLEPIE